MDIDDAPEGEIEESIDEAEQVDAPEEAEPTLEDVASGMGWSPKDKWRGDPDAWKPASKFVADTADINTKFNNKISNLERQIGNMARTSATITEQALAKQRDELIQAKQEAFDTGDSDKFNEIEQKLRAVPEPSASPAPEAEQFVEKNKAWWGVDAEATAWATNRADELAKQKIGAARQIAIVERELAQLFPELVAAPAATAKPSPLSKPGSRGNQRAAAQTFAAMPKEMQTAALEFEKRGRCSKEEYAAIYFEEQG